MGYFFTSRARETSNLTRAWVRAGSCAALALLRWSGPAAAQKTVFVGPRSGSDVFVDLSALDQLGSQPGLPGLMPGQPGDQGVIVVRPPSHKPAAKKVAKAPKTPKPAEATDTQVASAPPAADSPTPGATEGPASVTPPVIPAPAAATPTASTPTASTPTASTPDAATPGAATPPAPPATPGPTPITPPSVAAAPAPAAPTPATPPAADASAVTPTPPAPTPPQTPPQVAAVPPTQAPMPTGPEGHPSLSLSFAAGATDLADQDKPALDKIVDALKKNDDARVQLLAYATGGEDQTSQSRRISLIRGLSVRTYLIEQGISSARIDVRALGNKVEGGGAVDRVDLVLTNK